MTDSEFLFQQRQEQERAERKFRKPNLNIGMVSVEENAFTRIGALAFIKSSKHKDGKREPHHDRAAEEFKSRYEALYGNGSPAMDPGRVQVDTSVKAHDNAIAARIDRGALLRQARTDLGKEAFDRLVAALVLCIPIGDGCHWRERVARVDQVLDDLEELGMVWGYRSRAA